MIDIVTGGCGFIGSHLVDSLRARGRDVFVIDLKSPTPIDITGGMFELPADIDTFYHLAGLSNIIPSISHPRDYYDTNVTGTLNMLEYAMANGCKKFVYAASASCYGKSEMPAKEEDACFAHYPYALTKYMGEQLVMHWSQVYKLPAASLRIFNAYGPRSLTKNAYGAMFNTFLAQKANGKPLTIVGDGTQSRDFIYVDDVVEAFILAAQKGSGIYNLGTGNPTTVKKVAELIGAERRRIAERGGEPHTIFADNTRLKSLGWEAKVSIEQGIGRLLENLEYWKDAKVWEPDAIAEETKEWSKWLA